jgi:hypothetical protein
MQGGVVEQLVPRSLAPAPAEVEASSKSAVVVVAVQVAWMKAMVDQMVH